MFGTLGMDSLEMRISRLELNNQSNVELSKLIIAQFIAINKRLEEIEKRLKALESQE